MGGVGGVERRVLGWELNWVFYPGKHYVVLNTTLSGGRICCYSIANDNIWGFGCGFDDWGLRVWKGLWKGEKTVGICWGCGLWKSGVRFLL